MKIKKTLINSLIFFAPFLLIIYLLFCLNVLIKDFRFGHKSHNFNPGPSNWAVYHIELNKQKFLNFLLKFNKNNKGLKREYIQIPEKTSNKLLNEVPSSTKNYLQAKLIDNGNVKNVRLRYRGDNPCNWMSHQKSIRIKTRKNDLINGRRYIQYIVPQTRPIWEYIPFKLAKKLDLLAPEVSLIELFINGKSHGVFRKIERVNEGFLRRNKIMPINIYKGEQLNNAENKIGLEDNLYINSGLWKKISFFNMTPVEDRSDLSLFFENLRKAESSNKYLNDILKYGNKELFAKKAVLQILLQNLTGASDHNQRIAIDPWSGKIHHIIIDSHYIENLTSENKNDLQFEFLNTDLHRTLSQSSYFLDKKYEMLFEYVVKKKILSKMVNDLEKIKKDYLISINKNYGNIQRKYPDCSDPAKENEIAFNQTLVSLKDREKNIENLFLTNPSASWEKNDKGFFVKIDKLMPLLNLSVKFKDLNPKWIALDLNNNQLLDKSDKYYYPDENGKFFINVTLFANRNLVKDLSKIKFNEKLIISNTKFNFFVDQNLIPSELITYNKFTKKNLKLFENKKKSSLPTTNNVPIINQEKKQNTILKGNITVDSNLIFEEKTEIKKGTIFNVANGVSIVFRNKVQAIGSENEPIIFKNKDTNDNWGGLVIHGKNTEGSIFSNIRIENASGNKIDGINYFASLSVHSTKNLRFNNILIKDSHIYDDMVHVVYGDDIKFNNVTLENAKNDAIDIDISKNILLENFKVLNSGNDGLDLMTSSVELFNSSILSSGDKGISVGEGSDIIIKDTIIEKNNYGIASKDNSRVNIDNSLLKNNKIQLSTYKKNWRYGDSGIINMKNSSLTAKNNKINGDKDGSITINSTLVKGELIKKGNVNFTD